MSLKVLIVGAGEQASGTAHRLFRCGMQVVMVDQPRPTAVRRTVSFATALYEGEIEVEGVKARAWALEDAGELTRFDWSHLPVFADPESSIRQRWRPQVIIDARILKRSVGNAPSHAALVLGYGPGISAGHDVHLVIETNRGHDLGRIISAGTAAADTGIPGSIAGHSTGRVLRAPCDGTLEVLCDIGSLVQTGQELARVAGSSIHASVGGIVRGMAQPGLSVQRGQKLGDVDPRGDASACHTISDKARTISGAALEAIVARFGLGACGP